jgi:hypothetical protein
MKLTIKKGGGVPFARKLPYEYEGIKYEADLKNGDIIKILDSGNIEPNQFGGESKNFKIKTRNGEKKMAFNQKSLNVLIEEFGDETEEWINKNVSVILHKGVFAGKKGIACYFVTKGWGLDEYGELVKEGNSSQEEDIDLDGLDEIPD